MVGNIYLAKIYFTDLSAYKIRPVLVIKELDDDCICLQLTSQIKENAFIITQQDVLKGILKKDSFVIVPKNFTLHKSILIKYLATIKPEVMLNIIRELCLTLGCN
jgi:mRNA interferase MazF